MRYIARAPVHCASRDQRPGDSFDAEPDEVADLLAQGHVDKVGAPIAVATESDAGGQEPPAESAVTPPPPAGKKAKK